MGNRLTKLEGSAFSISTPIVRGKHETATGYTGRSNVLATKTAIWSRETVVVVP